MNTNEAIHQQVNSNAVVLCMKGTPQFPQCGFSGSTVQMLQACGVKNLTAVDVLADPGMKTTRPAAGSETPQQQQEAG